VIAVAAGNRHRGRDGKLWCAVRDGRGVPISELNVGLGSADWTTVGNVTRWGVCADGN
jgi:hypothetical protein